jgi:hypothetical protein
MHDSEAAGWMKSTPATPVCDRGWITDLQYVGLGGVPAASCHDTEVAAGLSYIQRLDVSGAEPIPHDPAKADGYASAFAEFAKKCPKLHVWVVGNEPNVGWGADVELTSTANAAAYVAVHKRVHAIAGHESDLVLLAPDSPYSPACICSLRKAIRKVKAKGIKPDGYAVHAYTQAQGPSDLPGMKALVASEAMSSSNDVCGYPFHWQFRIYRDWIKAIEAEGEGGRPVLITESGNACKPAPGNKCYPDADIGYFQALWAEIDAWNATAATRVRAITPYRWTPNDDGTGRDFAIGSRPALLGDLKKAFEKKHAWTAPATCGAPVDTCGDDGGCAGRQICDLGSSKCVGTSPCGAGGACAAGSLCRTGTLDCVPISRGEAKIEVKPTAPAPGADVTIDASASVGYTNVAMDLAGPTATIPTKWKGMAPPSFHWLWSAKVTSAGTHRATLRADPAGKTYAIGYFNVGTIYWPDAGGTGEAGPADAAPDASASADGGGGGGAGADGAFDPSRREAEGLSGGCSCAVVRAATGAHGLVALVGALALRAALTARRRRSTL